MVEHPFRVRAPGRVCLFGEHSDYLGLDVIAAAIDMEIEITAEPRTDSEVHIIYSDLGEEDTFTLESDIAYRNHRDYIRSAFNVMARKGIQPLHGWNLQIKGTIPIAAGLSSSSALTVGAVMAIAKMSGRKIAEGDTALTAYDAEVREFGESGGTMDHYASVYGGVIHVDMEKGHVTKLPAKLGSLVIGDSGEKKRNTVGDLRFIRTSVEREYQIISERIGSFNRRTTTSVEVATLRNRKSATEFRMAEATLRNRDLTSRALELLSRENPNPKVIGLLMNAHHEVLRNELDRSTPKIERMIAAAREVGALGCKINGSGGGGTMMAYCPGREKEVERAIRDECGKAYKVSIGSGARIHG